VSNADLACEALKKHSYWLALNPSARPADESMNLLACVEEAIAAARAEQRRRDAEVVRATVPNEVWLYSEERGSYSEKEDADAALERAARAVEAQGGP
jgi:hypothetical protein